VAGRVIKLMVRKGLPCAGTRALVMGLAFKENCPDLRNTRVVDIIDELGGYGIEVDVYDPWVDAAQAEEEYGVRTIEAPETGTYHAVVLAVAHRQFRAMSGAELRSLCVEGGVIYDVKHLLPPDQADGRL
jgi:UDP-N-acetyl-D-galactosamine dehydrogenase